MGKIKINSSLATARYTIHNKWAEGYKKNRYHQTNTVELSYWSDLAIPNSWALPAATARPAWWVQILVAEEGQTSFATTTSMMTPSCSSVSQTPDHPHTGPLQQLLLVQLGLINQTAWQLPQQLVLSSHHGCVLGGAPSFLHLHQPINMLHLWVSFQWFGLLNFRWVSIFV